MSSQKLLMLLPNVHCVEESIDDSFDNSLAIAFSQFGGILELFYHSLDPISMEFHGFSLL